MRLTPASLPHRVPPLLRRRARLDAPGPVSALEPWPVQHGFPTPTIPLRTVCSHIARYRTASTASLPRASSPWRRPVDASSGAVLRGVSPVMSLSPCTDPPPPTLPSRLSPGSITTELSTLAQPACVRENGGRTAFPVAPPLSPFATRPGADDRSSCSRPNPLPIPIGAMLYSTRSHPNTITRCRHLTYATTSLGHALVALSRPFPHPCRTSSDGPLWRTAPPSTHVNPSPYVGPSLGSDPPPRPHVLPAPGITVQFPVRHGLLAIGWPARPPTSHPLLLSWAAPSYWQIGDVVIRPCSSARV